MQYTNSIDKIRLIAKIKDDNDELLLNFLEALAKNNVISTSYQIRDGKSYGTMFGGKDEDGRKLGTVFFRISLAKIKTKHELPEVQPEEVEDMTEYLEEDGTHGWRYVFQLYKNHARRKTHEYKVREEYLRLELEFNPNKFKITPMMKQTVQDLINFTDIETIKLTRIDIALDFNQDIINGYEFFDDVPNRTSAKYKIGNQQTGWLVGRNGNNVQICIYDKNKERADNNQLMDITKDIWHRCEVRLSGPKVMDNLLNLEDFNPFEKCGLAKVIRFRPEMIEIPDMKNPKSISDYDITITALTLLEYSPDLFKKRFTSKATQAKYRKKLAELTRTETLPLYEVFEDMKKGLIFDVLATIPQLSTQFLK